MKRIIAVVGVVLLVLAFLAGYWPEHRQLTQARSEIAMLQSRLDPAEESVRLAAVLGQLLRLSDAVDARNYGDAAGLSSAFFDTVRVEASRATRPDVRATLEDILNTRDRVTTAIAGADPTLPMLLKEHERKLRQALGYPVATP